MPSKRILILAGTSEARLLANRLVADGHDVVSSYAGVTQHPHLPEGEIRVGGFGGAHGLRHYFVAGKFDDLIDATHPFAAAISRNAFEAWPELLRLERPAWVQEAGDNWQAANSIDAAVGALPNHARVLLTIGRKEIGDFMARADLSGVVRMIEPPEQTLPAAWKLVLERPPFTLESELTLLRNAKISHLVCKNAGGSQTAEKLEAARILKVKVVMIARPLKPEAHIFTSIDAIAAYIGSR